MATPSAPQTELSYTQARIVDDIFARFGGTNPEFVSSGEANKVVIVADAPEPYVIRFPRDPSGIPNARTYDLTLYEGAILDILSEQRDVAPTKFPAVRECRGLPCRPTPLSDPYIVLSYLPGVTLTTEQIADASAKVQTALAEKLVDEVLWMADALRSDDPRVAKFNELSRGLAARNFVYDKRADLFSYASPLDFLAAKGWRTLGGITKALGGAFLQMLAQGKVKCNILGHHDRRPPNWIFTNTENDEPVLDATIDYGQAQGTTYEQELRFVPMLGDLVLGAVCTSFYDRTGQELNIDIVHFWDRVQVTSKAVKCVQRDFKYGSPQNIRSELERVWPNEDWSEITNEKRLYL